MNLSTEWSPILGATLGAFVAIVGAATLVGMPWTNTGGGLGLSVVRALGAVLTLAVGAGVVYLALRGDLADAV